MIAGGLGIIASILGILAFLFVEALPLMQGAGRGDWKTGNSKAGSALASVVLDESKTRFVALDTAGTLRVGHTRTSPLNTTKGQSAELQNEVALLAASQSDEPRPIIVESRVLAPNSIAALVSDGRILVQTWSWEVDPSKDPVEIEARLADIQITEPPTKGALPLLWTVALDANTGSHKVVVVNGEGSIQLETVSFEENPITGEKTASTERQTITTGEELTAIALDRSLDELYATTNSGELLWWTLSKSADPVRESRDGPTIVHIGFLLGGRSLILGGDDGSLTQWFSTRKNSKDLRLTRVRAFEKMPARITGISQSQRNKAFVVTDAKGNVAYYYGTTGERSFIDATSLENVSTATLTPKSDGLVVAGARGFVRADLEDPHPEATLSTYFARTWYEGYDEPSYEWESTGGSNEFEPKLSLVPLIFGTLKATIFSMLLAIPLAVLGAMFVSQFMHPRLRALIKPAIEIMAAMPSVILGFVAALWLAPLLEAGFTAFLLMFLVLPVCVVVAGALWVRVPARIRKRFTFGSEVFVFMIAIVAGMALCIALDDPMENLFFGGDFPTWVRTTVGIPYEQKNSVVIAIAMSFAVVPIIFSISEDAFSNVPRNLVSGSLALGANRWQTVTRVVLPTASPGIFSATMVGFGRAIGETMIVLMATGNTAIMEWNPFNGFRTLSANIATEIPEAPVGGTLYRTLFLTALLLFVLTFLINTLAEVVRIRLRTRYSNL